jgi:hypothetical protein
MRWHSRRLARYSFMVEDDDSEGGRKFDESDRGEKASPEPSPSPGWRANPYSIMFVIIVAATMALWTAFLLWLAVKIIAWIIAII